MTAPTSPPGRSLNGDSRGSVEDAAMRSTVAAVNAAVRVLSSVARAWELDSPRTAAHLRRLSQELAGITLDALRSWPSSKR